VVVNLLHLGEIDKPLFFLATAAAIFNPKYGDAATNGYATLRDRTLLFSPISLMTWPLPLFSGWPGFSVIFS